MNFDKTWIFQDSATTTGIGKLLYSNRNDNCTIFITGTSTSRTIQFEGIDNEGNVFPIQGVRLSDYTKATLTTGTNEAWTIDISNVVGFQVHITTIAGGTVRVTGKVFESSHTLATSSSSSITGSLAKGPDNNYFSVNNLTLECRGRNASKPSASDYPFYTYWSVDTDPHMNALEVSDGSNWVVV